MVLAELNNRLPPVAGERRLLWRRGQRKFALQVIIFFGYRKSKECRPKIIDFRANGIPVLERVDYIDTLKVPKTYVFGTLCLSPEFAQKQNYR